MTRQDQALLLRGDVAAALPVVEQALRQDPADVEAHLYRARCLFLLGRWPEAWREYEWRQAQPGQVVPPAPVPRWDGRPCPAATLLCHGEQGFGDVLMFARYLPLMAARVGRIVLVCLPALRQLFRQQAWPRVTVATEPRDIGSDYTLVVPLLSAGLLFGTTPATVPPSPYLTPHPALVAQWRARLPSTGLRVGLCWAGSPRHPQDAQRSMPPALLAPLSAVPGVTWVNLQTGPAAAQTLPGLRFHALGRDLGDFASTGALVACLDLVITVDTAVSHLAGALGIPVWNLLAYVADWRWGLACETTPWYASMRLFRQHAPGGWSPLVARVVDALSAFSP